jgi:hypothetical protein
LVLNFVDLAQLKQVSELVKIASNNELADNYQKRPLSVDVIRQMVPFLCAGVKLVDGPASFNVLDAKNLVLVVVHSHVGFIELYVQTPCSLDTQVPLSLNLDDLTIFENAQADALVETDETDKRGLA